MDRKILTRITVVFAAVGLLYFGYVLVRSMNPSDRAIAEAQYKIVLSEIKEGVLTEVDSRGGPLLVFRPSEEQWADIKFMDAHVWDTRHSGYNEEHDLFVYWGISTRFGCELSHLPKGESRIAEWGGVWLGGYFDHCHDSSYDYAGRTIRTYEYTGSGFTLEVPNLRSPNYEIYNEGLLIKLL